jgi:hypothetical protein
MRRRRKACAGREPDMKQCPNPDCLSYQQQRKFYDDDTICPRCGDVLVSTNAPAGAPVVVDPYPA